MTYHLVTVVLAVQSVSGIVGFFTLSESEARRSRNFFDGEYSNTRMILLGPVGVVAATVLVSRQT